MRVKIKKQTKSQFDPGISSPFLESFQQAVIGDVLEKWDTIGTPKHNLKKEEWEALRELKNDDSHIVKKSCQRGRHYYNG